MSDYSQLNIDLCEIEHLKKKNNDLLIWPHKKKHVYQSVAI